MLSAVAPDVWMHRVAWGLTKLQKTSLHKMMCKCILNQKRVLDGFGIFWVIMIKAPKPHVTARPNRTMASWPNRSEQFYATETRSATNSLFTLAG